MPWVSVIIPVVGDEQGLGPAMESARRGDDVEIVIADGGGTEGESPEGDGARRIRTHRPRARQMNEAAREAKGRWLLFLHADCRLPHGWHDELRRADADPGIVGGSFQLALDEPGWRPRLVAWGARQRVRWLGLPYGDQALFVRKEAFADLGGYGEMPLMEDVDLVRRLRRKGRLLHSRLEVATSARRWRRDGWLRRSAMNAVLIGLHFAGVDPSRLARWYHRRRAEVIAVMARSPGAPGKTRLWVSLGRSPDTGLQQALLLDTLEAVSMVRHADHVVLYSPASAGAGMRALVPESFALLPQRGGDLGERLLGGFEDLFALGYRSAVIVGSDVPTLPPAEVGRALLALRRDPDRVVLGPAEDGGYYLIGLGRPHGDLFREMPWGTSEVCARTEEAARRLGLPVTRLAPWYDVDEAADLQRVAAGASSGRGRRTRQWFSRQ